MPDTHHLFTDRRIERVLELHASQLSVLHKEIRLCFAMLAVAGAALMTGLLQILLLHGYAQILYGVFCISCGIWILRIALAVARSLIHYVRVLMGDSILAYRDLEEGEKRN